MFQPTIVGPRHSPRKLVRRGRIGTIHTGVLSWTLLFALLTTTLVSCSPPEPATVTTRPADVGRQSSRGPLFFANRGQAPASVDYYLVGQRAGAAFTVDGLTLALRAADSDSGADAPDGWAVRLDLVGGQPGLHPVPVGTPRASTSWYKGPSDAWVEHAPAYTSIAYREVWDGIDLIYGTNDGRLDYTVLVRPGADPAAVRFQYGGVDRVRVGEDGDLEVTSPAGDFRESRPVAYQDTPLGRRLVDVAFQVDANPDLGGYIHGFTVGQYDRALPLVLQGLAIVINTLRATQAQILCPASHMLRSILA